MKAIITGSGGLIGSECVRFLSAEGWDVLGIDNNMRQQFFGAAGSTLPAVSELRERFLDTGTTIWIFVIARESVSFSPPKSRTL